MTHPGAHVIAAASPRLEAIDQFRGFAIFTMVLANYLAGVRWIPAWLKHAPDVGLTVIDLIAPFFIFAIGLTYGRSAVRRLARHGWGGTLTHFFRRFLTLLGLGALLAAGETLLLEPQNWGVLQAIGVAGLVTLPLIFWPAWSRVLLGLALLGGYQWLLDRFWLSTVLHSSHGGLLGALSWSAMLILATALADLALDLRGATAAPAPHGLRNLAVATALTLAAGLALAVWVPVSKNRVSASYVLISLGASAGVFTVFSLLQGRLRLPLLAAWGQNPLLLYTLHLILLGLMVLPGVPGWYAEAPAWLVAAQAVGLLAVLSAVAVGMVRRGWRVWL